MDEEHESLLNIVKNKKSNLTKNKLEENKWIFAKTMPETPHFYTLRRTWSDEKKFESIVEYIREHGVKEKFEGKEYIYLHLGDFKYWTMGEAVKDTILINRAKI